MAKEDKLEAAQHLLSLCEKPYILKGTKEDLEYYEIAKRFENFFVVDGDIIFSVKLLKDFWENEIETALYDREKKEIKLRDIVKIGLEAFFNLYKVAHPKLAYKDFYWGTEDEMFGQEPFYDNYLNEVTYYGGIELFIHRRVLTDKYKSEFYFDSGFEIKRINIKNQSLVLEIKHLLLKTVNQKIPFKILLHKLNTCEAQFEIEKPIKAETLLELLKKQPKLFVLPFKNTWEIKDDSEIELIDHTKRYLEYLSTSVFEYDKIKEKDLNGEEGLFALYYSGNDFPLEEAQEYVKIRPFIYISEAKNLFGEIRSLFELLTFDEKPITIFAALLKGKLELNYNLHSGVERLSEWMKQNIKISCYACDFAEAQEIKEDLLIVASPVLNMDNNLGNFFINVIEKKKSEFLALEVK